MAALVVDDIGLCRRGHFHITGTAGNVWSIIWHHCCSSIRRRRRGLHGQGGQGIKRKVQRLGWHDHGSWIRMIVPHHSPHGGGIAASAMGSAAAATDRGGAITIAKPVLQQLRIQRPRVCQGIRRGDRGDGV